jgi:hypothetical protein
MAVRSLLILNGGAALGLITFASNSAAHPIAQSHALDLKWTVGSFGLGAALSVLTAGLSYLAQSNYSYASKADSSSERKREVGDCYKKCAIACASVGLVCFLVGVVVVFVELW